MHAPNKFFATSSEVKGGIVKKSLQTKKPEITRSRVTQTTREADFRSASGLTLAQLKNLKLRLCEIREELLRSVQVKTQHVLSFGFELESTLKGDDAEVAEKQRLSNANLQELDFLKSRLALVDRALLKMSENCYGLCEESEEPVGFERLQVVPWARFSIKVQEKREIRSREFGRVARAE